MGFQRVRYNGQLTKENKKRGGIKLHSLCTSSSLSSVRPIKELLSWVLSQSRYRMKEGVKSGEDERAFKGKRRRAT